jgi:hypothetical protein
VTYTRIVDTPELNTLLRGQNGAVTRELLRRGLRVEAGAKRRVKADHGRLRQSITHTVTSTGGSPAVQVGTNVSYALAVHNGTGVYGPRGTPITPKRGRFLVFEPRGGAVITRRGATRLVFAKSVTGQRANPFLADALRDV